MATARLQRKMVTQEHPEKIWRRKCGRWNWGTAGERWKAAAQNRTRWRQVVCHLRSTNSDKAESSL